MSASLDFVSHTDYLVALLPAWLLVATAMAVLMGDAFSREPGSATGRRWIGPVAAVAVLLAGVANGLLMGVEVTTAVPIVAVDSFTIVGNFIVLGATFLTALFARDYLEREDLGPGEFYALLLLAAVGMITLIAARDLILLFVGLELMSIAVYVLTGYATRSARSSEAGLKYFLVGAFASAFLLYGIALIYGATGTTSLVRIAATVSAAAASGDVLLIAGTGLLLIGFGFKIAAVPFHMWTPDAYEGAPTPITGFMATGVKAAAFLALLRVITVDLSAAESVWSPVIWWLAILTMIVPNLIALAQDNVKRMLAYSSVAHAGYLLVGVEAASELGRAADFFYLAVYTLMTLGAFGVVYLVAGKGDERSRLADYRGLGWRRPVLGAALVLFLLSLAGFPPTGGFVGKLYLLQSAIDAGHMTLAIVLVLTSLVAYYYYLRVVWKMYFDEAPEDAPVPQAPGGSFRLATALCAAGILVAGLLPGAALRIARAAGGDSGANAATAVVSVSPAARGPAAAPAVSLQPEPEASGPESQ
jgi:NADH-quinone oxidoreductase subunit N